MLFILVNFSCSTWTIEDHNAGVSSVDEDGAELGLEILLLTEVINDPGLKREKRYELEGFRPSGG